jgi:hypothetical protein
MGVGNRGESQCRPAGAGNGQGGLSEESARRAVVCRGKDGDGGQSRAEQSRGGCFATQDPERVVRAVFAEEVQREVEVLVGFGKNTGVLRKTSREGRGSQRSAGRLV